MNGKTCVVQLTPSGRGAVATLLVTGPKASESVAHHLHTRSRLPWEQRGPKAVVVGHWGSPAGEELVVCRLNQQKVEIHCHGGDAAVAALMADLVQRGCERMNWSDWLAGERIDRIGVEAFVALASARTQRTAAILLDQYAGALAQQVGAAELSVTQGDWLRAGELVSSLLAYSDLGLHLIKPWQVVFAGRPNVGKSSLINALLGYRRAIVAATPGTTRDVLTETVSLQGWPTELADTAGWRPTDDAIELAGYVHAKRTLAEADLVIWVEDASKPVTGSLQEQTSGPAATISVHNKCDLVVGIDQLAGQLVTSARTGQGVTRLEKAIVDCLIPQVPPPGAAVPFTARQVAALKTARQAICAADLPAVRDCWQCIRRGNPTSAPRGVAGR